jgi:hypothetical protein
LGEAYSAAAGFIDKTGKIVLSDGNHRMNAALKYAVETGDNKFVEALINKGNFTKNVDLKQYGIKAYNLPTK